MVQVNMFQVIIFDYQIHHNSAIPFRVWLYILWKETGPVGCNRVSSCHETLHIVSREIMDTHNIYCRFTSSAFDVHVEVVELCLTKTILKPPVPLQQRLGQQHSSTSRSPEQYSFRLMALKLLLSFRVFLCLWGN